MGSKQWTIQRNWQHRVHMTKKNTKSSYFFREQSFQNQVFRHRCMVHTRSTANYWRKLWGRPFWRHVDLSATQNSSRSQMAQKRILSDAMFVVNLNQAVVLEMILLLYSNFSWYSRCDIIVLMVMVELFNYEEGDRIERMIEISPMK